MTRSLAPWALLVVALGLALSTAPRAALRAQSGAAPATAAPADRALWKELDWSQQLARDVGGTAEFRLPNGARIDVLESRTTAGLTLEQIAWEVEWCPKWKEAVGQSLFYALSLDGAAGHPVRPGIWLLKRPGDVDDEAYLQVLAVVRELRARGLDVRLRVQDVPARPAP